LIWVILIIIAFIVFMITLGFIIWANHESPLERAKREQIATIRARAVRANYELDQAAFAARRAIFEAIRQGHRDRDS
jgi:hypothetical protein